MKVVRSAVMCATQKIWVCAHLPYNPSGKRKKIMKEYIVELPSIDNRTNID
jgi:hypothetical protein